MLNSIHKVTKHISFHPAEVSDAEFILSLRLDESKNKYLSKVEDDIEAQRQWLRQYKERESQGSEYYFIIRDQSQENMGAIRIYDLRENTFSWGSWILKHGVPMYAAIESALTVCEIGFVEAGFNQSHFEVQKGNDSVIAFHKRFGAVEVSEDDKEVRFILPSEGYAKAKEKYKRYF